MPSATSSDVIMVTPVGALFSVKVIGVVPVATTVNVPPVPCTMLVVVALVMVGAVATLIVNVPFTWLSM